MFHGIGQVLRHFFRLRPIIYHKDRAASVEMWRTYGQQEVARRDPRHQYDILARQYNANVYIAIRAISDAVRSLPARVVAIEMADGRETEKAYTDHEANELIRHPNSEMTLREVIAHNVQCYLGDGNAYMTIERLTGPNPRIEIWPRDPRGVERMIEGGKPGRYKVGADTRHTIFYRADRMLHIRDFDASDPLYGKPRHEAVRDEIMLDHSVNQFNKKFFESGAALNFMFTPDKKLQGDQHDQLLEMMRADVEGEDNWFSIFINKFPGKLESTQTKHVDIAFLELLKHNREKIFGVFGLPPFRGGVMEYSNYANALAQDKDFWNNTIKPVTRVVEDAYNKQLVWPRFGEDVSLRFDYTDVPALRGDPKQQAEIHKIYFNAGVLTDDEIREDLGLAPLPESKKKRRQPDEGPPRDPEDEEPPGAEPTREEEQSIANTIHAQFRQQKRAVLAAIKGFTTNGALMSRFMDATAEARKLYNREQSNRELHAACLPELKTIMRTRASAGLKEHGVPGAFRAESRDAKKVLTLAKMSLNDINQDTFLVLTSIFTDCDTYKWRLGQLNRAVRQVFTSDRAQKVARPILTEMIRQVDALVFARMGSAIMSAERHC